MLASFLSGEFLLHIRSSDHFHLGRFSYTSCWLHFYVGSFFSTYSAGFNLISGFLLHNPYWFHFYGGSFSYTSRAGFICMWGVSLTHPMLTSFNVGSFSYTSRAAFFLCREFLVHFPFCLDFYGRSSSYTSHAGYRSYRISLIDPVLVSFSFLIGGVSLTYPELPSFLSGMFVLHVQCCLLFMQGISRTLPVLS